MVAEAVNNRHFATGGGDACRRTARVGRYRSRTVRDAPVRTVDLAAWTITAALVLAGLIGLFVAFWPAACLVSAVVVFAGWFFLIDDVEADG